MAGQENEIARLMQQVNGVARARMSQPYNEFMVAEQATDRWQFQQRPRSPQVASPRTGSPRGTYGGRPTELAVARRELSRFRKENVALLREN